MGEWLEQKEFFLTCIAELCVIVFRMFRQLIKVEPSQDDLFRLYSNQIYFEHLFQFRYEISFCLPSSTTMTSSK